MRYIPNRHARALTGVRTQTIGLIFFHDINTLFAPDTRNDLYKPYTPLPVVVIPSPVEQADKTTISVLAKERRAASAAENKET